MFFLTIIFAGSTACKLNLATFDVSENDNSLTQQTDSTKLTLIDREGEKPSNFGEDRY